MRNSRMHAVPPPVKDREKGNARPGAQTADVRPAAENNGRRQRSLGTPRHCLWRVTAHACTAVQAAAGSGAALVYAAGHRGVGVRTSHRLLESAG